MTKYNDYLMLAGKDRRVTENKATRRSRNRFGQVAVSRNKIQDVPAENRGKNRFCHSAARKHRVEPVEAMKPLSPPAYGILTGRENGLFEKLAAKKQRNGFSRVAMKGNGRESSPAERNSRNRFTMNVRVGNHVSDDRTSPPIAEYRLLAGRERRLMIHPQRKQFRLLAGRGRRLMIHPHGKRYHLLAGRDRRLPVRSEGKQFRLLGGRSRRFKTLWLPMVPVVEMPRRIAPVIVAKRDLAVIGGRPYGRIYPFRPIDDNETLIGG